MPRGDEKFDDRFLPVFLAGTLILLPLSPLLGYIVKQLRIAYGFDYVIGIYLVTIPHMLFFMFMGGWFLHMYFAQLKYDKEKS